MTFGDPMSLVMAPKKPRLLTVKEVADHFSTGRSQVNRWIREGRLPAIRIGRLIRIEPSSLEDFERRHRLGTE